MLAAQGDRAPATSTIAVAGGMESMSNAPYLLPRVREGLRMGNGEIVDSMIHDGLWCAFEKCHMGHVRRSRRRASTACRATRQDAYAAESHRKAAARDGSRLRSRDEIVPIDDPAEEGRADRRRSRRSRSARTRRLRRSRR